MALASLAGIELRMFKNYMFKLTAATLCLLLTTSAADLPSKKYLNLTAIVLTIFAAKRFHGVPETVDRSASRAASLLICVVEGMHSGSSPLPPLKC
jgi:hypothetical protein